MKILIFGLPGSGKSTFAKKLIKDKKIPCFNADKIRKLFEDWDFSEEGRKRQAIRMKTMCELTNNHAVVDFICPYNSYRSYYDITVFMDTINKSRFDDTNKIFEKPDVSTYRITNFNYENILKEIYDRL
jgi:adenylylsulfate kinase